MIEIKVKSSHLEITMFLYQSRTILSKLRCLTKIYQFPMKNCTLFLSKIVQMSAISMMSLVRDVGLEIKYRIIHISHGEKINNSNRRRAISKPSLSKRQNLQNLVLASDLM